MNNKQLTKVEGCLSVLNLINFRKHLIIGVETGEQMKENIRILLKLISLLQ